MISFGLYIQVEPTEDATYFFSCKIVLSVLFNNTIIFQREGQGPPTAVDQ